MKDMIYALVDVQKSAGKMEDIITGKGNGLVRTKEAMLILDSGRCMTDAHLLDLDYSPPR